MSDVLTVEFDTTKMNERIAELQAAFIGQGQPGDSGVIVLDESRLAMAQVIRLTPPKNKKQGEEAVARDLLKIFTPIDEEFLNIVGSEHGVSGIDAWITASNGKDVHLKWDRLDPSGSGMANFHQQNRNRRGRTRKLKRADSGNAWYSPYVVSFDDFKRYGDKTKARVGRRKAAWAKSLIALGGRAAAWILRHMSGARGTVFMVLDPQNTSVTMSNFSPGILDDERIVRSALRIRYQAMGRRLKLVLSGYAADVAQGIRISRKAKKTPLAEAA